MFVDRVERDHRQSDAAFRRRRVVVAATIVVGATLLGLSFSTEPGDPAFYPLTFGLAATWALGSVLSGPLHLGHIMFRGGMRRPVLTDYARRAGFDEVTVLPIEDFGFFRFYRLS